MPPEEPARPATVAGLILEVALRFFQTLIPGGRLAGENQGGDEGDNNGADEQ